MDHSPFAARKERRKFLAHKIALTKKPKFHPFAAAMNYEPSTMNPS
jgi:hypothetical protein